METWSPGRGARVCAGDGISVKAIGGSVTGRGVEMAESAHEEYRHEPVLLSRCLDLLAPALSGDRGHVPVVVDATLGLGGHAQALLDRCPDAVLVGIDRDEQALELAGRRLEAYTGRVHLAHAVYDELPQVLSGLAVPAVDAVLFDLGVSSLQLDAVQRGFAYAVDAPLDMRMDASTGPTAADVLNTYSVADLARVLRDYGEERFAHRIATAVARERARRPFETSARLVDLVREVIPAPARRTGGHPAKRTFQALRVEVNAELTVLERAVPAALGALRVGGRIVAMAYQSLEDRIVKRHLVAASSSGGPPGLPVELERFAPRFRLLTRGAERAGEDETQDNPRAASVRLRAAERLRPDDAGDAGGGTTR